MYKKNFKHFLHLKLLKVIYILYVWDHLKDLTWSSSHGKWKGMRLMHAHYLITLYCFALEVETKVNPELSLYIQCALFCTITFKFMCVQIQSLYIV